MTYSPHHTVAWALRWGLGIVALMCGMCWGITGAVGHVQGLPPVVIPNSAGRCTALVNERGRPIPHVVRRDTSWYEVWCVGRTLDTMTLNGR